MNRSKNLIGFNIFSGCASILSLFLMAFSVKWCAYIALAFFVMFLMSLILLQWWAVYKMIRKENQQEFKKLTAFASYETSDGVRGVYESFRVIQSKRLALHHIDWNFKWSGSQKPKLYSDLQDIEGDVVDGGAEYDHIRMVFKQPLSFNETATVHFRAEVDDIDGKAEPYSAYKVDAPINLVHFHITLKHKPVDYNKPAVIQRRLINVKLPIPYTNICTVPFDKDTKSYQYNLLTPEIGYYYRICWEK